MVEDQTTTQEKLKDKIFRLRPEDDAKLLDLIQLAHKMALIPKPSFQGFMEFAINRAYDYIKQEYERQRGLG